MSTMRRKAATGSSDVASPSAVLSPPPTSSRPAPVTSAPSKDPSTPATAQTLIAEVFDWERFGQRGEVWFAAQFLLILPVLFPPAFLRPIVNVEGGCMVILGIAIMVMGGVHLGASLTPVPLPRNVHTLVTDGVFALCRHPMYGGGLVALAGLALATGSETRVVLVPFLFWVLNEKANLEERYLEERYGEAYAEYKRTTPFKLIPWLF